MSFALRKKFVDASYAPEQRRRGPKPTTQRLLAWEEKRHEIASFERWLDERKEQNPTDDRLADFAELLTPLFLFLSAGWKPTANSRRGTMDVRAWVLLYSIRPDLIDGETLTEAAERYGISPARLVYLLREFKRYLPDYVRPSIQSRGEDASSGIEIPFPEVQ